MVKTRKCSFKNCGESSETGVKLFNFRKFDHMKWIEACKNPNLKKLALTSLLRTVPAAIFDDVSLHMLCAKCKAVHLAATFNGLSRTHKWNNFPYSYDFATTLKLSLYMHIYAEYTSITPRSTSASSAFYGGLSLAIYHLLPTLATITLTDIIL